MRETMKRMLVSVFKYLMNNSLWIPDSFHRCVKRTGPNGTRRATGFTVFDSFSSLTSVRDRTAAGNPIDFRQGLCLIDLLDERLAVFEDEVLDLDVNVCGACRAKLLELTIDRVVAACRPDAQAVEGNATSTTARASPGANPSEEFLDQVCRSVRNALRLPALGAAETRPLLLGSVPPRMR